MATTARAFMAGFMAAMKIYDAANNREMANQLAPAAEGKKNALPPAGDRALENYLAIPTFIRQGRAIGG